MVVVSWIAHFCCQIVMFSCRLHWDCLCTADNPMGITTKFRHSNVGNDFLRGDMALPANGKVVLASDKIVGRGRLQEATLQ